MANIATVNGNIIEDSAVSLVNEPTFPYEPTITHDVGPESRIYGISKVYASTLYSYFFTYPIIGKQYPDPSLNVKAYSITAFASSNQIFTANVQPYGQTSTSINNIEAIYLNSSTMIFNMAQAGMSTLTFTHLKYFICGDVSFQITANSLATLNFPELLFIARGIQIVNSTAITSISFPKLEVIGGTFTNNAPNIATYNFPEALEIFNFNDSQSTAVTAYSFPKLKVLSGFTLTGTKSSLTSISFGALIHYAAGTFNMPTTSASLSSFTFANTLKSFGANFVTTSNSLNQASVDNILVRLAALDGTNGTAAYSNKTVTITGGAATPSATGLAAITTLQARGCTVTTN